MDKKFIEQSKFLRIEYFKAVKEIASSEKKVEKYKNDLDDIQELIEKGDKEIILSAIIEFEKKIKQIEESLSPQVNKIKDLEKKADQLFDNIKECYPDMTIEEIHYELIPHLKDINLVL